MKNNWKFFVCAMAFFFFYLSLSAESDDLKLLDWQPVSQMVVKETKILKPKFPVIDVHNHLGNLENTKKYLEEMDKAGVWKCVSLDARSADDGYKEHLRISQSVSKERFLLFFVPVAPRVLSALYSHASFRPSPP